MYHARVQAFFQRDGGGVQARRLENSLCDIFLVLNLFYSLQRGSNGFCTEKLYFSNADSEVPWGPIFSRGCPTFSRGEGGGGQMLISIETHITCDFPEWGGSGPPIPLLDPPRHAYIIELLGHCNGDNFKIDIWAWFGNFICSRRKIRFYLSGKELISCLSRAKRACIS